MKKVLVVDSSKSFRAMVRKEREKDGYELHEAETEKEAIRNIQEFKPDLIILEIELPESNGFDICARFRFEGIEHEGAFARYNVPVIFVTGNDDIKNREKASFVGASDCITKPFMKGEILTAVNAVLMPSSELSKLNVLVVDDDNLARYFVKSVLCEEGVNIIEACNGDEAVKILLADDKKFDLIITDFLMPNMNGDELCKIIRTDIGLKEIPIIMLSGTADRDDVINIFKAGATDYLTKPFIREEFLARSKMHLANKRLTFELQKRINELKKLNKLKDDFLSVAAHDLRSPLSGILCSTDILANKIKEEDKKYVDYITNSVHFLNNMIKDILDLNRIRSDKMDLEMNPVVLCGIIKTSLETMQHMAMPKNIEIITLCKEEPVPTILGDYNALMRISNNIISNAIKFTPADGKITVTVGVEGEYALFGVEDSGIGIPKDHIAKLFDKFSKASRTGTAGEKGNGLGLSITKELVEWHNGTMDITSEEKKGTTILIKFPLHKDK